MWGLGRLNSGDPEGVTCHETPKGQIQNFLSHLTRQQMIKMSMETQLCLLREIMVYLHYL